MTSISPVYILIYFLVLVTNIYHVTGYVINTNRDTPLQKTIKRSIEGISAVKEPDKPDLVTTKSNDTVLDKVNQTHDESVNGHGVHKHEQAHGHHHSIHVASWNFHYVEAPFVISVFLIVAGIAKLGFHHANFLSSKVPESCLLIILGTVVGAILYGVFPDSEEHRRGMTAELFFLYLLFPIILESAFSLHDRTFFENIGTVLIYAVLGTVLNCFLIGPTLYGLYLVGGMGDNMPDLRLIQCLVFSAIIVAVDPVAVLAIFQEVGVNNTLYFLVFGESLLNDAVTVVLYNTMKTLNLMDDITVDQVLLGIIQFFVVSLGGLAVGILFGALTAIMTKFTQHCRVVEPLAVFVLAYIAFLVAEMFHLSGIISIIGCGLTQAQYAFHNISRKSFTTVKYFSKMMSATSDCVIFMFLGIALFKHEVLNIEYWNIGFILWTILFCFLYRFVVVFGLTFVLNKSNRLQRKIDLEEQFIMAYGGLRGAVAFSLVDVLREENLPKGHFLTTTLVVIFCTVFIQGSTIKPLVKFLRVKMEDKKKLQLGEEINDHVTDHVMAGIEEILGQKGQYHFRIRHFDRTMMIYSEHLHDRQIVLAYLTEELIEYYNSRYLKVWLQRNPISTDEQIMHCYERLALEQHFETLAGSKMIKDKYASSTHLMENVSIDSNEPEESAGEDETEDDDDIMNEMFLPGPSLHASSEDISSELDQEMLSKMRHRGKRKTMFTVDIPKDLHERLLENPTAQDVRKIMVPSRRQMQYKRLNKNITSEDSENDLLQFLKEKQMRARRASNVFFAPSEQSTPAGTPMFDRSPRKSLVPSEITQNYRRRLSLAVPTQPARYRGASVGNVALSIDSPARRRLRMKRRAFSEHSEDGSQDFKSSAPKLGTLSEHEDEEEVRNGDTSKLSGTLSDIQTESEPSPSTKLLDESSSSNNTNNSANIKRDSFKRPRPISYPGQGSLKRHSSPKHVPSRSSPSVKRKLFQNSKSTERELSTVEKHNSKDEKQINTDENHSQVSEKVDLPSSSDQTSPLRKNVSYLNAMTEATDDSHL